MKKKKKTKRERGNREARTDTHVEQGELPLQAQPPKPKRTGHRRAAERGSFRCIPGGLFELTFIKIKLVAPTGPLQPPGWDDQPLPRDSLVVGQTSLKAPGLKLHHLTATLTCTLASWVQTGGCRTVRPQFSPLWNGAVTEHAAQTRCEGDRRTAWDTLRAQYTSTSIDAPILLLSQLMRSPNYFNNERLLEFS